jgi:MYXO-CTERM domain-containing protein
VFLAAQGHPEIDAVVVLDANDDASMGMAAAPSLTQPTAHLMAEVMGACNATNWKDTVFPLTTSPHMRLVVHGAGHCDVEDPTDALCGFACTAGAGTSVAPVFRRYAVAFMGCVLQSDPAMAPYVGGASMGADATAGTIQYVSSDGLDTLPCNGGVLPDPDAGTIPEDAAVIADAAVTADAASPVDAARADVGALDRDAGSVGMDAATTPGSSAGGCGCRASSSSPNRASVLGALWLLAIAARRVKR